MPLGWESTIFSLNDGFYQGYLMTCGYRMIVTAGSFPKNPHPEWSQRTWGLSHTHSSWAHYVI